MGTTKLRTTFPCCGKMVPGTFEVADSATEFFHRSCRKCKKSWTIKINLVKVTKDGTKLHCLEWMEPKPDVLLYSVKEITKLLKSLRLHTRSAQWAEQYEGGVDADGRSTDDDRYLSINDDSTVVTVNRADGTAEAWLEWNGKVWED